MDITLSSPLLHKTFYEKNKFYLKFDVLSRRKYFFTCYIYFW